MRQTKFLSLAVETLEALGVPHVVVGSFACMAYGESRFTQDIDIVAAFEPRHVVGLLAAFPPPEFYVSETALREAIRNGSQFNVIHPGSGNKIDFMMPRREDWARGQIDRGRSIPLLPDRDARVAAPEDIILGKLWYYSMGGGDRHLRDIAGILRVTGHGVNRAEVERWAKELGYLEVWEQIVKRVDGPDLSPGPGAP